MKKILLIGTAVFGMFFMATSCLDNTEPAGIEELRNAKSELIRAQAAYEQARIALIEAEAAMQEALTQGALLDNQLKELELRERELDLELQEAENEHAIRMMELEYLLTQEENNARIEEIKMEIAELELRQMQLELDMQELELAKETMVQQHELELLELQTQLAEAQATYEQTLRDIEAAKHGLTQGEQDKIQQYIDAIDAIRIDLDAAEAQLISAQNDLVNLKFNRGYDSLVTHQQYVNNVNYWQREVDNMNADLEEVRNLDLTGGAEDLLAEVEDIEDRIAGLEAQADQLTIDADAKEYEKDEPNAVKEELQDSIQLVREEIDGLMDQINNGGDKSALNYQATRELAVPESVANVVGGALNTAISDLLSNYELEVMVVSGFEYVDLEYTLPSGVFSWIATEWDNLNYILPAFADALNQYVLPDPAIQNLRNDLENFRLDLSASRFYETYEEHLENYRQAVKEYAEFAAEYGVINREHYANDNLMVKAQEAAEYLQSLIDEGTPLDGSAVVEPVTEALAAIRLEQEIRDTLFNNAYSGWENITYANLTSEATAPNHIDISFVFSAYQNSYNEYENSSYDIWNSYTYSYGAEQTDWSILQRWNEASFNLYNLEFVEDEITVEELMIGEYLGMEFDPDNLYSPGLYYLGDSNMIDRYYQSLGYTDAYAVTGTEIFMYCYNRFIEESVQSYLDNLGEFPVLVAGIEAQRGELAEVGVIDTETLKTMYDRVVELNNLMVDLYDRIDGQDEIIAEIDLEISEINDQIYNINNQIARLNTTKGIIEGIIRGVEIEIGGAIYNPLTDDLEGIKADYIAVLEDDLALAERELERAQANLERLESAEDPGAVAVEDAERAVEKAQERYNELLERFNYYNDLLSDFLTTVIGSGE